MIQAGLVAARFAHYAALTTLFGAAVFVLFAASSPREAAPSPPRSGQRLRPVLLFSSLATFAAAALVLAFTAANLSGSLGGMIDPSTLQTIVVDTDFGRVWMFRLAATAALTAWLALRRAPGRGDWTALLLAGAVLSTTALTGHAQIRTGLEGVVHRAADAAHLVAAAVWLGALPPFLLLLRRSGASAGEGAVRAGRLLQRFHWVGTLAVTTLLATGLVNSWFLVGEPSALASTTYGRLLLLKLALFAVMVGLAADNRLRLVPKLRRTLAEGTPPEAWLARLRGHVFWEFALGLGILLVVAVLGTVAPAIDAAAT